jgi:hypothetical protein
MTQLFEDFLVEVHNDAINAEEDESKALGRIGGYFEAHLACIAAAARAAAIPAGVELDREQSRLVIAFGDKGLTTDLSQRIFDMLSRARPVQTDAHSVGLDIR